jgi:hypothetical protein
LSDSGLADDGVARGSGFFDVAIRSPRHCGA